jgi:hypothetical protein
MKYNDIKQYVTSEQERMIYYQLPQNHEIVQELFEVFGNDRDSVDWKEVEEYLKKKAPNWKWVLVSIDSQGNNITSYNVNDRYKPAMIYLVEYKGITFRFDFLMNGECYDATHTFNIYHLDQFMKSSHHNLPHCETLEGYYQKALEDVAKSKRKYMTHYNKKIKEIKQTYKRILKYHNNQLKRSD